MSIYNKSGSELHVAYQIDGANVATAYDVTGNIVFPTSPIPTGDLISTNVIALPDIHGTGHGFTCTGLAYDSGTFLVGDIGAILPGAANNSQIVRLATDFTTVIEIIPLYSLFPGIAGIQGIAVDTSDNTIWFCVPDENKIYHISKNGSAIGTITVSAPTGIAYSPIEDLFWVLNYQNKILKVTKTGTVIESYTFGYSERLDQCFLDFTRGYLYITAGTNYTTRNNVYLFNTNNHTQSITCTVDSYAVEGIWIGQNEMVILNDGYFHSALVNVNQANIYSL